MESIRSTPCATKGDELLISGGNLASYPHGSNPSPPDEPIHAQISLARMEQIFPSPVDDVDPVTLVADENRPSPANRPWVVSNMISSLDGAIAVDGVSGGLGGAGDKAMFSALRAIPDVILVASRTVVAENYRRPQTPPHIQDMREARGQSRLPRIAIVTARLSIEPTHQIFDPEARPMIITHGASPVPKRESLAKGADIVIAGETEVDLPAALEHLHEQGARCALLEGGPTLNGAFAAADLIDEWSLSSAPVIVGGTGGRAVKSSHSSEPRQFSLARTLHDEGFLFHRYLRNR